jgi:hypothetical protein
LTLRSVYSFYEYACVFISQPIKTFVVLVVLLGLVIVFLATAALVLACRALLHGEQLVEQRLTDSGDAHVARALGCLFFEEANFVKHKVKNVHAQNIENKSCIAIKLVCPMKQRYQKECILECGDLCIAQIVHVNHETFEPQLDPRRIQQQRDHYPIRQIEAWHAVKDCVERGKHEMREN